MNPCYCVVAVVATVAVISSVSVTVDELMTKQYKTAAMLRRFLRHWGGLTVEKFEKY
jgi:ABC-type antimicrobial peptide transport system permease subunit